MPRARGGCSASCSSCCDLGAIAIKGFDAPMLVWQVLRPSMVGSRFEALCASVLAPLVGREEELELLLRRWQRAKARESQIVSVSGQPGVGKSPLTTALHGLEAEPACAISARRTILPVHRPARTRRRFRARRHGRYAAEQARSAACADRIAARPGTVGRFDVIAGDTLIQRRSSAGSARRSRPSRAVLRKLTDLARRQPVLMVFEDLYWIDPARANCSICS